MAHPHILLISRILFIREILQQWNPIKLCTLLFSIIVLVISKSKGLCGPRAAFKLLLIAICNKFVAICERWITWKEQHLPEINLEVLNNYLYTFLGNLLPSYDIIIIYY